MNWVVLVFSVDDDLLFAIGVNSKEEAKAKADEIEARDQDLRCERMPLERDLYPLDHYS